MTLSRRKLIGMGAAGAGGLLLGGCDRLNASSGFRDSLASAEGLTMRAQRLLMGDALAREFTEREMSPSFRVNGNSKVEDTAYRRALASGFAGWTLRVDGLVQRPLALGLDALKGLPQRTQITRHDCVEGWSAIGKWQGPQLGPILAAAGLLPEARFAVFHCADAFDGKPYYESIDLIDAFHPQTILAWRMNDAPLSEGHGAPVRLRVERQLGYKQAKFVMRIELRATLAGLYGGKGGYWEDHRGYQWYAGI
ncbi:MULTISPECIES: molybdopterin-dependent oxidoreductase [unclassified Novosphingobium]|uniref:molybdopterin-dependent oxidoreductase n=1 Tax=unclassified Novosphingobium TaxID=2644732 RepID=UPI000EEA15D2|nr:MULTISPECIES: molybdopterin-dependent oxidoreductase [unclassified Novosphingobium]HCF25439.1 molybdopterin-binding protein [Novosphingobium sp.]HQV04549.1 molybdopterin-dependent oxidoreductase [Novosphingobium sp.]